MISKKEVEEIVKNIVEIQFGNETEFDKIESIRFVELVIRIEDEFNIEFDDDDLNMEVLGSYEKLAEYVLSKL